MPLNLICIFVKRTYMLFPMHYMLANRCYMNEKEAAWF